MRGLEGFYRGINLGGWLSQCDHTKDTYDNFIKEEDIPQMITWALAETNPFYPVPVIYDRKRCEAVIRRIISEA